MASLSITTSEYSKAEGNSGSTPFVFEVKLDEANAGATTVAWAVASWSPADAADFTGGVLPSGTLTLAAGQTSKLLTINVAGDTVSESDEYFYVYLSDPSANASLSWQSSAYPYILDDDTARLTISGSDAYKDEGTGGITPFVFTVSRSGKTTGASSAVWTVTHYSYGNGTSDDDFEGGVPPSGTVNFAAGETSKQITVNVVGDSTAENTEYFDITLSDPVGAEIQNASTMGYVYDDDTPYLYIYDESSYKSEGNSGSTPFTFRVVRDGGAGGANVVDWAVSGGTATADDFAGGVFASGKVTFTAGQTQKYLTVQVAGDTLPESNESFDVALSNPTNGAVLTYSASASGTIMDDDTPTLAITANQDVKPEGNSGTTPFTFTVTRSGNTSIVSKVVWTVAAYGGSPASAADFSSGTLPTSGTLTFAAGQTQRILTVGVVGDAVSESDEAFSVTLSSPTNATLANPSSVASTILDDDTFRYRIDADATQSSRLERDGDSLRHLFIVTRSGKTNVASSIGWSVQGGATDPAAAADFVGGVLPAGTLSFAAGETRKVITVSVVGDNVKENDETFDLVLGTPPAGAVLEQGTATGTIRDDDRPRFGIAAMPLASVPEGDKGSTPYVFWVTRTGNTTAGSVGWAVTGTIGYGHDAATAADFTGAVLPSGTISFAAGEIWKPLTIQVAGETARESNEGFTVTLSNPVGGLLQDGATTAPGYIVDEDNTRLTVAGYGSVSQPEGNSGTTQLKFTVNRAGQIAGATVVSWNVTHDTGWYDATEDDDFVGAVLPSGTFTFAAGETTRSLTVRIAGDNSVESDEYFRLNLSSATALVPAPSMGVIENDDGVPEIGIYGGGQSEGDSGFTPFTFTVWRTGSNAAVSTVKWAVSAGTSGDIANATDFGTFPTGILTFLPGESYKPITVPVKGDTAVEADESFTVTLSNPTGATLATPTATGTILNDDSAVLRILTTNTSSRNEGDVGTPPLVFDIQRTGGLGGTSSVKWTVSASGTSPAGAGDFAGGVFPTGTVTFAPGETSRLVTVAVKGDVVVESDETFTVTLSKPVNATLSTTPSETYRAGTILDDDTTRYQIMGGGGLPEGNGANRQWVYTVYRTGQPVAGSVQWQVTHAPGDGPHATQSDFLGNVMPSGQISFAAGELNQTLTVTVKGDLLDEPDESFRVELFSPVGGILGTSQSATGNIVDDDLTWLSFSSASTNVSATEGNSGSTPFVFEISRTGDILGTSAVRWVATGATDWYTSGGTASADGTARANDFAGGAFPSGWVTFTGGEACKRITINVAGDTVREADDRFWVTLTEATGAEIRPYSSQYQALGTILDDDTPLVALNAAIHFAQAEGNSGTTPFVFSFDRSGKTTGVTTVTWQTTVSSSLIYGTPATPADFKGGLLPSGTVTFAAGETHKRVTVSVKGDLTVEPDEQFVVEATGITGGVLVYSGFGTSTTILDDDALRYTLTGDDHRMEGDTGTTAYVFKLARSGATLPAGAVKWQVQGDGANLPPAAASDFAGGMLPIGTVSFAAGQTFRYITVSVQGDALVEPEEGFTLGVTNLSGKVSLAETAATIVDDDNTVFGADLVGNYGVTEGNAGATPYYLTVFRRGHTSLAGSVRWVIQPNPSVNTRADAFDFAGNVLPGGNVSFAAGQTSRLITLNIKGDTQVEDNESFVVHLYGAVGGVIEANNVAGQIQDDDRSVINVTSPSTRNEGNSGSTPFVFTFFRTGPATGSARVVWRLANCPTGGYYYSSSLGPVATNDIVGGLNQTGTVVFAAGVTQRLVTILVAGDTAAETDEGFTLLLSDPVGGTLGTTQVSATIADDDRAYLSIGSDSSYRPEGNSGTTALTYRVSRTGKTTGSSSVDWKVVPQPGGEAATAADFVGGVVPSGKVTFAAGETEKVITVPVRGDTAVEPDEYFEVELLNPVGGQIRYGASHGTILNDDGPPSYSVYAKNGTQVEADTQSRSYVFDVSRSGNTAAASSVGWEVVPSVFGYSSPGGYGLASANDFVGGAFPRGTLSFAAGQTSRSVTVTVAGDTTFELDERFTFTLNTSDHVQATATIRNDDSPILGTAAANALAGTDGNDLLIGGAGADTVAGFGGDDLFFFNAPSDGMDTLLDFNTDGTDRIVVNSPNFGGLPQGELSYLNYATNTATSPDHRFIFNYTTGTLQYDSDGSGPSAAVSIARVQAGGAVGYTQILVSGGLG